MSEHEKATPRPWKVVCGSRGSVHESRPYQIVGIDGKAVSSWGGGILRRAAALIEQMRDALKERDTTLADEELIAAAEKFLKEGQ